MRPTGPPTRESGSQTEKMSSDAPDDTLMLGFELFDEKGKFNPRNILFSAQTSPSKASSIFTRVFGRLMKWNANRWATNYFSGFLQDQKINESTTKSEIQKFIQNIKQVGSVNRGEFHRLATVAMLQTDLSVSDATESAQDLRQKKSNTSPEFNNRDDVICNTLIEAMKESATKKKFSEFFGPVSEKTVQRWIDQHIRNNEIKNKMYQWLKNFSTTEEQSSSEHQALAAEKIQPTQISSNKGQSVPEQADIKVIGTDMNFKPLKEKKINDEKKAYEIIRENWEDLSQIREGKYADPLIREAFKSGFLDYCERGLQNPDNAKLFTLRKFILGYQNEFYRYKGILSDHQYEELVIQAKKLMEDIEITERNLKKINSIFHDKDRLNANDLDEINWNPLTLNERLQISDIEKIHAFYLEAEPNELNIELAERIKKFAKDISKNYLATDAAGTARGKFLLRASTHLQDLTQTFIKKSTSAVTNDQAGNTIDQKQLRERIRSALTDDTTKQAAHIVLANKWLNFNAIREGYIDPPAPLAAVMNSGFISYCSYGYSHLSTLDMSELEALEQLAMEDEEAWSSLLEFINEEQLSEIMVSRQALLTDIPRSRNDSQHQQNRIVMATDDDTSDIDSDSSSISNDSLNQIMIQQLKEVNLFLEQRSENRKTRSTSGPNT